MFNQSNTISKQDFPISMETIIQNGSDPQAEFIISSPSFPVHVEESTDPQTEHTPKNVTAETDTYVDIYTIQEGDSLYKISRKFYSPKNEKEVRRGVMQLLEANTWLKEPNKLPIGKQLQIPKLNLIPKDNKKVFVEKGFELPTTHKVSFGETLNSIAAYYYNDSKQWLTILDANPGLDPCNIKAGVIIKIPALHHK